MTEANTAVIEESRREQDASSVTGRSAEIGIFRGAARWLVTRFASGGMQKEFKGTIFDAHPDCTELQRLLNQANLKEIDDVRLAIVQGRQIDPEIVSRLFAQPEDLDRFLACLKKIAHSARGQRPEREVNELDPTRVMASQKRVSDVLEKVRALRLDSGNFSWGSENCTRKVRIMDVVYNSTNNELVRTKTLVKNAIVLVDATLFKQWYLTRYGVDLSKKGKGQKEGEAVTGSRHAKAVKAGRNAQNKLDPALNEQFQSGRVLAAISSRPGQSGRADGYVLEGDELLFYKKKMDKKKKA